MTYITNRSLISCIGSKIQFVCIKAFAFYRPSSTYHLKISSLICNSDFMWRFILEYTWLVIRFTPRISSHRMQLWFTYYCKASWLCKEITFILLFAHFKVILFNSLPSYLHIIEVGLVCEELFIHVKPQTTV